VPVGIAVLVVAARALRGGEIARRARLDVPGAVAATAGLAALTLAITQIERYGWTASQVLVPVAAALALLTTFVVLQRRGRDPLMPLGILRLPGLAAANLVTLVSGAGLFAVWFFLTLYMQRVLGYGPIEAGLAFLPHTFGIIAGTEITSRWLADKDPRMTISLALSLSAVGFALLSLADVDGSYVLNIALPGTIVMLGAGIAFPPVIGAATAGVAPSLHGLASGILNTTRMVGGALGLAILATVAASRSAEVAGAAAVDGEALVAGFQLAHLLAAGTMVLAAALAWLLPSPRRRAAAAAAPEPAR